ncbi:protein TolR [Acuticoccus mangrovi]|uniref:Protein TolR n=1 Tax=Acuticoccus mangrovi TaxID=2796142 RepID=A0A934MM37_9HYPH|nr:protein TolR [Acuticoccus mangrovi]MBJ3776924.1 protein TolR [Acuticoccus mangrovi]
MGMSSPNMGGGAGRGRRRGRRFQPVAEINVTPFVDVMLVLLIIFMVSAPLLTVGVPIDLPQSTAKPLEGDVDPLTISIQADGKIFLQEEEIDIDTLITRLQAIAGAGYEERILVRGDASSDYGAIMRVMGRLNRAGFNRIGLVTTEEPS